MRLSGFALLAVLTVLSGSACSRRGAALSPYTLHVQLSSEPASLDPTLAEDGVSLLVLDNVMEGLVGYDGAGHLMPLAASSYAVSSDGLRYDFTLRTGARWSDGRPVMAQDFVTAFRRALSPGSGARLAGTLFPIRGAHEFFSGKVKPEALAARAEGPEHLVIELETPTPYFIQALTLPVALPERQDVLDAHGGAWPETAPSNGAYLIKSHEVDRRIVLEKNPRYWAAKPEAPDVELLLVGDDASSLNLFEEGGLDIMTRVGAADLPRLRKHLGVVRTDPFLATYYLAFNFRKPPFDSREWRQAVAGSIRREELVKALDSGDMPARSWVPPGLEGFIPYTDPSPVFAQATAQVRKNRISSPIGPIVAAYDTGVRNTMVMEKVQQDLKRALGLQLSLSNLDWKSYLKSVHTDPSQIFRLGILSPFMDPIQILESFTTDDPNNYLHWSDAEYDGLVREIARLKPGAERARKIRQAQELLVDREAIVVPIFHYVQNHAVSARVEGFRANPFGVIRFSELRLGEGH